jgi:exosortase B
VQPTPSSPAAAHASQRKGADLLAGADPLAAAWVLGGLALLYGPSLWRRLSGEWAGDAQGHELLIVAVSAWLFFRARAAIVSLRTPPATWSGGMLLAAGLTIFLAGRLLDSVRLDALSMIAVAAGLLAVLRGWAAVRLAWFPLFFLCFAVPLPHELLLTLTGPLKQAVSVVATEILHLLGFPVGRTGVLITIGQYQLLVVEACAGLQTMFTLEAMGLLYASLVQHPSLSRKALLAVLVVPISFMANVVRVMVLALITFWFGDAAGQGFLHGFAGLLLFAVALALIIAVDGLLGRLLDRRGSAG